MKKFLLAAPVAVVAIGIAAVASPAFAAQPTTTTHNLTMPATSEAVIDLPALNSQFTKMVLTADGTANWGADLYTAYSPNGDYARTNRDLTSGIWNNGGVEDGPLIAEGTQVGKVVYRIDGGAWTPLDTATTIDPEGDGTHKVQVAYNDRPGSYYDNSGSLDLKVFRSK